MRLLVDIGNTRIKLAVFNNNKLLRVFSEPMLSKSLVYNLMNMYPKINLVFSLSSNKNVELNRNHFDKFNLKFIEFNSNKYASLFSSYEGSLGDDRMALSIGALSIYSQNTLIIDMGTCVTYDLVLNGIYKGGQISPGLQSRLESLKQTTSSLPLLNFDIPEDFIGTSTEKCILSGVYYGLLSEIELMIKRYTSANQLTVVLTGGDSQYFKKNIKNVIFDDNLLMKGLNCILNETI